MSMSYSGHTVNLSNLQLEAGDVPQNDHCHTQDYVRSELEEPERRPLNTELKGDHGPQVEHTQTRTGADRHGVLVVRLEFVSKCPV